MLELLIASLEPKTAAQQAWTELALKRREDVRAGRASCARRRGTCQGPRVARMSRYWLHPDAEAELGEAARYYAEHASRAIAEAFLLEYERVRDLLIANPARGSHDEAGLRRYHFDRFPTP